MLNQLKYTSLLIINLTKWVDLDFILYSNHNPHAYDENLLFIFATLEKLLFLIGAPNPTNKYEISKQKKKKQVIEIN